MNRYDVIVIGGGLLGCFAARSLTRYRLKTALLERREDICTGISRANTAIVYSGCDTKPGTLKTSMCVSAARGFEDLCGELGVRYSRCGSIMVCFGERGAGVLRKKLEQGRENGVRGIRLLSRKEVLELEPRLSARVHAGLYVPDTGTVVPWELCIAAAETAAKNGAEIVLNAEVTEIVRENGGYRLIAGGRDYYARGIINCAGLSADKVYEMVSEPIVRIVPDAGDYFVLDTKAAGYIRHVIFHEPEKRGKGLTLVPTVDGNILAGPTERADGGGYKTTPDGLNSLRALVSEVMPSLPMELVIRSFGAVRPNPYLVRRDPASGEYVTDDRSVKDFCVIEAQNQPPFISLVGVKTPGLTCACGLGGYISDKMAVLLGGAEENPDYKPYRKPPLRLNELSFEERSRAIRENPAYGRIVCRCGKVSEGEIVDAIRRFPGAVTADGVKRRAGTGLGRCQGAFCTQRVIEILARELGCAPEDITKDGGGSYILRKSDDGGI